MGLRDYFRSAPHEEMMKVYEPDMVEEYSERFEAGMKALSTFGEPVNPVGSESYLDQPQVEHWLLMVVADYLAAAFVRATLEVHDANGVQVREHPIERAYRHPKGGRGAFWRGTMRDWIERGLWVHGYDKTPGRRIYRAYRIPRAQLQIPLQYQYQRGAPVWLWTRLNHTMERFGMNDLTWGMWRPDDDNEYDGKSPFSAPSLQNVLRLDKAASRYEADAFQRSGGMGLLFNSPTVAKVETMATEEQRDAGMAELQELFEGRTTGKYRGSPLVVGDGTEVTTYGVSLKDMNLGQFHERAAEEILMPFQIPPAAIGIRIGRDPTYANARIWQAAAYESGVLPRMTEVAEAIGQSMLTQTEQMRGYHVVFRTDDEIRAKLEDRKITQTLWIALVRYGLVSVWEARRHIEGVDPDPALEAQLQAAIMLNLAGASPQITANDPRLAAVLADALDLEDVAPLERLEGEDAVVGPQHLPGPRDRVMSDVEERDSQAMDDEHGTS